MTVPPPANDLVSVIVAVLTYRREVQLGLLLPQLVAQAERLDDAGLTRSATTIVVVDNDASGSARPIAEPWSPRVRYVHELTAGIAAGRARAVREAAGADVVVFIDDDEEPTPEWLAGMVGTWLHHGRPGGVAGRVCPTYAGETDPWIDAGGFFKRRQYATGTPVPAASSANLLLDLGALRDLELNFDERLGLRGGEDTQLTQTLTRSGRQLLWCNEAAVIDHIPPSRMNRRWVLRRAFSHAAVTSRLALHFSGGGPVARAKLGLVGLGRIVAGLGMAAAGVATRRLRFRARGWRLVYRGAGLLFGSLGRDVVEYGRSTA